jgi:predicted alpha/beta-hydrolase family hydrolase
MTFIAQELARQGEKAGGVRVVRFEFPYMAASRRAGKKRPPDREAVLLDCWTRQLESGELAGHSRKRLLIGGKSLGGRMASLIADRAGVAGLICLGYPFHPPGKPERLRTAHLETLQTPCLICQGERDPFGRREEVESYGLPETIRYGWAPDGDHGLKPRKTSGRSEEENLAETVATIIAFLGELRREG